MPGPRPLESQWDEDGHHHRIIKREGLVVLVEKTRPVASKTAPARPGWVSYEVAILNVFPAEERFGRHYPEREVYPPSSQWGNQGWTCVTRRDAESRFARVTFEKTPDPLHMPPDNQNASSAPPRSKE